MELHADNTFECRYDYMERDASFEFKGSYRIEKNLLTAVGERSDTRITRWKRTGFASSTPKSSPSPERRERCMY